MFESQPSKVTVRQDILATIPNRKVHGTEDFLFLRPLKMSELVVKLNKCT